jgi:hypothetical protein
MTGADLSPSEHQDPEVQRVLRMLVEKKWTLRKEGHWGRLYCPCAGKCTTIPVGGTPRNAGQAARKIERLAARCPLDPDDPRRSLAGRPRDSE